MLEDLEKAVDRIRARGISVTIDDQPDAIIVTLAAEGVKEEELERALYLMANPRVSPDSWKQGVEQLNRLLPTEP